MYLPQKKTRKEKDALASAMRQYQKAQAKEEVVSAPLLTPDPTLPIAIIVDVDGTLAKRDKTVRGIYDFDKSIKDEVFLQIKYILDLINDANKWQNQKVGKTHIIILTGREDRYKEVTNEWLNRHQIPFDHVFMRRTGDRREAAIVKEEIYAGSIRGRYNILFVLEDTKKVIDKFRSLGLYCLVADNSRE